MFLIIFMLCIGIFNQYSNGLTDPPEVPLNDVPTESEVVPPADESKFSPLITGCSNTNNPCCCNYTACFGLEKQIHHSESAQDAHFSSDDTSYCPQKSVSGKDCLMHPSNQMIPSENQVESTTGTNLPDETTNQIHPLGNCNTCVTCPPSQICCPSGYCCPTGCGRIGLCV